MSLGVKFQALDKWFMVLTVTYLSKVSFEHVHKFVIEKKS